MSAIFETDPKIGRAPAGIIVSNRRMIQKLGTILELSSVGLGHAPAARADALSIGHFYQVLLSC